MLFNKRSNKSLQPLQATPIFKNENTRSNSLNKKIPTTRQLGLFKNCQLILGRYGFKITKDKLLFEDVIQELFTEIYASKSSANMSSLKAYLFKAFRYKLISKLKHDNRTVDLESGTIDYSFDISKETLLIEEETIEEKKNRVIESLSKLSKRQREIVYLRFYRNMSYEEISELMDINFQASRNLISHSLKALREFLRDFSKL